MRFVLALVLVLAALVSAQLPLNESEIDLQVPDTVPEPVFDSMPSSDASLDVEALPSTALASHAKLLTTSRPATTQTLQEFMTEYLKTLNVEIKERQLFAEGLTKLKVKAD